VIRICLDQCAISDLAKGKALGTARLRDKLLQAASDLLLICPVAPETIVETTGISTPNLRMEIHDLHCRLADARLGGPVWAFKSMWKLIEEETLALALSQPPPTAFEMINWKRVDDDQLASQTWSDILKAKEQMVVRVESHEPPKIEGPATLAITSTGVVREHASHVFRQIERVLAGESLDTKDHMGYELVEYLQQHGVTKSEFEKLKQDILWHRWEAIPVIFNRTQLAGQLEVDSRSEGNPRKYDVNNELDIPRLAVGLSHADLIITDAPMWEVCRKIKTSRWTETHVFAIRHVEKIIVQLDLMLSDSADADEKTARAEQRAK